MAGSIIWFAFIFGLIIGSFLNAWIWRLVVRKSIVRGRSECPECHHVLAAQDLVPVVSWLMLRGRCRYCHEKISWQYPLVELATAALFAYLAFLFGWSVLFVWLVVVSSLLLVIFVIDLRWSIIPDVVSIPLIFISALSLWLRPVTWLEVLTGGLVGGGFFLAQWLLSHGKWVGDGDIRLGVVMGLLLGWKLLVVALFLAYVVGAVWGVLLLLRHKKTLHSQLPFGTFLAAATWVCLLWGDHLLGWYLGFIGL